MRKLLFILPLACILCACPYESTVPLQERPVEPVDSSLFGYWYGIIKDGSDFFGIEALDISLYSDSVYSITRYGKAMKGDMIMPDTAYFTGYTSRIGELWFMNVQGSIVIVTPTKKKGPIVTTQKVYYISTISLSHDTLVVKTVTDNFSPVARKGFNSPAQLRTEVITLLGQKANIYDDTYSLSYRKIERPKPLN
jgi:hypothetical protein